VAFAIFAFFVAFLPARRPGRGAWAALGRMLVISLPLWLIMAPIRPSQPDTFLNLLPNAFYLVDYARLPSSAMPPSFSLLPAAPYNTQFLSFLGSLIEPDYPASGMSLVNVLLQLSAALVIAHALAAARMTPGWGVTAAGFLLAILFNPGFVPRIHFAAYGETGLAVMALLAAWMFVQAQGELNAGGRPRRLLPLALILAATVNIKQTGPGLVAALAGAALISACAERVSMTAGLRFTALAVLPAAVLYAIWRYHVMKAGVAELTPLPFAAWNWADLTVTAESAVRVVLAKPAYFGCAVTAMLLLPLLLSREGWTVTTRLLAFNAALFVLYNIFIFMTYIAAFPGEMSTEAHSYFRYNTHLSLVLVLSLALAARDVSGAAAWLQPRGLRLAGAAVLVLAVLAPVAFAKRLRFDLDMPQPLVWDLAKRLSEHLSDGDRLALLLPGDNGSVAAMISGVLADTAPRRRGLHLLFRDTADSAALAEAARLGYRFALISCTPPGWEDLPASEAVLLRHDPDSWHIVEAWPYPADANKQRWQHILSWGPLCRNS
jgi:hypothetical protein